MDGWLLQGRGWVGSLVELWVLMLSLSGGSQNYVEMQGISTGIRIVSWCGNTPTMTVDVVTRTLEHGFVEFSYNTIRLCLFLFLF